MNVTSNYHGELGINIDDLHSLDDALKLCTKLKAAALFIGGSHFISKLLAGLTNYSARDSKKIIEVDKVKISGTGRGLHYNLVCSSSLVELICSKNNIYSTISIFKFQNVNIFRLKSNPRSIKLIVKLNFIYLLKPLLFSSINFVKARPESCTSILANIILGCFDLQNDADKLIELCSAMGPKGSCIRLSLMENTILDEIHMMSECMNSTDIMTEIKFITSAYLHREYNFRKMPLLHYIDFISVDGYVIIYYFDTTGLSMIDYVMYIAQEEVINSIDHGISGNELRLESGFIGDVQFFLTKLFQNPFVSQQHKQLQSLYIANNDSHPYPISTIIAPFSTSLKHLKLEGDCIVKCDLQAFYQVMKSCNNLTSFSISGDSEICACDILASLRSCKQLNQVSLKNCYFNWVPGLAASYISHLNLVRLDLSYIEMSTLLLKSLAKLFKQWTMLQELDLNHCGISGKLLAYLIEGVRECKQLLALNISENKLGDEGCINLSKALCHLSQCNNVNLQRLNMSYCDITNNGVSALADLIKQISTSLQVLDISNNNISPLAFLAIIFALRSCDNLLELSFEVKDGIVSEESSCQVYASQQHSLINNRLKQVLVNAVRLRKLSLSGLHFKDTALQEQIRLQKQLLILTLTNCLFESDIPLYLLRSKTLQELDLSNNKYRAAEIFRTLQSCNIYAIHLDNTDLLQRIYYVAKSIENCKNLLVISVVNCNIQNGGAIRLAQGAKKSQNLRILDMRCNNDIGHYAYSCISDILSECLHLIIKHQ